VDIKMGTLSKGIPSVGGWVAGPESLVRYLKYTARPFVFSAALPAPQAGAALEALRILEAEPDRVTHTQAQATRLRDVLAAAGLNTGRSETAVIPLVAGSDERAYDFTTECRREGLVTCPVVTPAVQPGFARLRVAVTARHTEADIAFAAQAFITAARRCDLV
jgi:8-amino-7-oxononanoate synthase